MHCLSVDFFTIKVGYSCCRRRQRLNSSVPSNVGKDTKSSGPHCEWHLQFNILSNKKAINNNKHMMKGKKKRKEKRAGKNIV